MFQTWGLIFSVFPLTTTEKCCPQVGEQEGSQDTQGTALLEKGSPESAGDLLVGTQLLGD